ncbi:MAG: hypothetical protein ACU0DT_13995 [Albimonas sp.]|uniref:hypothetical protein n=1 Tax=Albimonas sp. TaxID=1872425 RepID=UPI0040568F68
MIIQPAFHQARGRARRGARAAAGCGALALALLAAPGWEGGAPRLGPAPAAAQPAGGVGLTPLVQTVKRAIVLLRTRTAEDGVVVIDRRKLAFSKAVLELSLVSSLQAEGGFAFSVVEAGADVTRENTQTLSVTLTPPRTGGVTPESVEDDARALADMIQAAAQELGEALKGDPPLGVSELSATLRFQVVSALGGKVGFKILGHGVSVGARGQEADVQKLTVTLSES